MLVAEIKQCPNCGSARRLSEESLAEATIRPDATPTMGTFRIPIPRPLSLEILIAALDVCVDCGIVYAKAIIKQPAVMGAPSLRRNDGNQG